MEFSKLPDTTYDEWLRAYRDAQKLDPLDLNRNILILRNSEELLQHVDAILSRKDLRFDSIPYNIALIRDLDFVISTLQVLNITPRCINDIDDLLSYSASIIGTVPRGTIYTFALANVEGNNRRTFTDDPREIRLQKHLSTSIVHLERAARNIEALMHLKIGAFGDTQRHLILEIVEQFETVASVISDSFSWLGAHFFDDTLGSFFGPRVIQGVKYYGPNPSHLQVMIVDHLLIGREFFTRKELYGEYFKFRFPYLESHHRQFLSRYTEEPLIVKLLRHCATSTEDLELVSSIEKLLYSIIKFRFPHKKMADNSTKEKGRHIPDDRNVLLMLRQGTTNALSNIRGVRETLIE